MPELTIVIPTFRRHDLLRRTLDALEAQTVASARFEVIVVDDPAGDDPDAVAGAIRAGERRYRTEQLHVEVPDNVSAKRNLGWRTARSPLVLFMGDDILAEPDMLAEHLAWHERDPDRSVGVLGHVRWADELPITTFMRWLDRGIQFDYERLEGSEAGWGMFYTSNVSLKRAMIEVVGGFDAERFPFMYEDTDLGFRLGEAGFRLLYNAHARAQHVHLPRLEDWKRRMNAAAPAERRCVELHPEMEPYFERLFRSAAAQPPPARARMAVALAGRLPGRLPWLGPRLWRRADLHFRQQLAPSFLSALTERS